MAAIETSNLTKQYEDTIALQAFDLTVERGEIFGFLGPNGAGKSTTIDILLDFVRPTDGEAEVAGHDPQQSPRKVRRDIGVLPDDYALYDSLTGREHIELAVSLNDSGEDPESVLARVGLADSGDEAVGSYSKGMSQRLAFGMALVGDPAVLVLDEPSSGIDPNGVQEIREMIREEADRGTTVFFSTHILEQVEAVCDRVGIIDGGELVAVDTIDGIRDRFDSHSTLSLSVDATPTDLELTDIDGVSTVEIAEGCVEVGLTDDDAKSTVITRVEASGASVTDIEIEEASLGELFARLTTEEADA